jgi:hypothetical protein
MTTGEVIQLRIAAAQQAAERGDLESLEAEWGRQYGEYLELTERQHGVYDYFGILACSHEVCMTEARKV